METLADLVDLYLARCRVEGKSPNTLRAYGGTLRRFLEVSGDVVAMQVGHAQILEYLSPYADTSLETRHRYFREVRCFFNWLVAASYIERNPFDGLRNVRLPQRIVYPFTPEDIAALLAATRRTPVGARDRALVLILLDTGIRCAEAAGLGLEHVVRPDRRLRILNGKGNRQRVVPFADRCAAALDEYLALRGSDEGPLFTAGRGDGELRPGVQLQVNGVKQALRRLGRRAGIARVHAHRFRHTFATAALEANAREIDIQVLLGHSSPDMVRRYTSSYRSEQAALRHAGFSPADRLVISQS